MIKELFSDSEKVSMGRLLSFSLFILCSVVWIYIKITGKDLSINDMQLIQWGWITAIGGKAISKFSENKK